MIKKQLVWSGYQNAIFKDISDGQGNTVVIARAGASKTTVLVEGVKHIPKGKKALFVAFNKKIAQELTERISKSYIDTKTLHSFGYTAIRNHFKNIKLDPDKADNIAILYLKEQGFKQFDKSVLETINSLTHAVALCKGSLKDTPSQIDMLMDQFDIETIDLDRDAFIKAVAQILYRCKKETSCVDYNDMVWMPFVYNLKVQHYD